MRVVVGIVVTVIVVIKTQFTEMCESRIFLNIFYYNLIIIIANLI